MVSILGDYSYDFPCKIPLKYHLKDLLETKVEEKYYLSDKMIEFFTFNSKKQKSYGNGFSFQPISVIEQDSVAKTVTTRNGSRMDDNFIDETSGGLLIKNATKQGCLEATDGDGIDISTRMETHRGTVQKNSCQTLTCQGGENVGVVVIDEQKNTKVD